MTAQRWRIDPTNPGEVLACAGIAHLAWRAQKDARTGFVDGETFVVEDGPGDVFSALRPVELQNAHHALLVSGTRLDWWADWGMNPQLKTWAGQQTEETVHRSLVGATAGTDPGEWLDHTTTAEGRLNVDTLGSWTSLGTGWSINAHNHVKMLCRPWVELLASFGLQAFGMAGGKADGFAYRLWKPAPLSTAVAAFTGHGPGVYADAAYHVPTGKAGSNTILLPARAA